MEIEKLIEELKNDNNYEKKENLILRLNFIKVTLLIFNLILII